MCSINYKERLESLDVRKTLPERGSGGHGYF